MHQYDEQPRVIFKGDDFKYDARSFQTPTPKIVEWVIKYSGGYIKDEKQASYVLLGFVALVVIISLFLIFGGGGSGHPQDTPSSPVPLIINKTI